MEAGFELGPRGLFVHLKEIQGTLARFEIAPLDASSGKTPTPPPRPRRQPPTQLRATPHRRHARPRTPTGTRLPGAQTERRQNTPRSDPLPQTTTRPHRLQHAESRYRLDIGATRARNDASLGEVKGPSSPQSRARMLRSWSSSCEPGSLPAVAVRQATCPSGRTRTAPSCRTPYRRDHSPVLSMSCPWAPTV